MKNLLIETFRGSLCPQLNPSGSDTKVFTASKAPAVKGNTQKFERVSAKVEKTAMAKEIEEFVRNTSIGKAGFNSETHVVTNGSDVAVTVVCSWDEPDPKPTEIPVAPVVAKSPEPPVVKAEPKTSLFHAKAEEVLAAP